MIPHPIMPFCFMDPKLLPKKIRDSLLVNWRPVYTIMENAIPTNCAPDELSTEDHEMLWNAGTDLLRARVAYCFQKPRSDLWGVATWSHAVQPSTIAKKGTDKDRLALEALPTKVQTWTRQQRTPHKRKRSQKVNPRHIPRSLPRHMTTPTPQANPEVVVIRQ